MDINNLPKSADAEMISSKLSELNVSHGIPEFACGNHWNSFKRYILVVTNTHFYTLKSKDGAIVEDTPIRDILKVETLLDTIKIVSAGNKGIVHKLDKVDQSRIVSILERHGKNKSGIKEMFQETKNQVIEGVTMSGEALKPNSEETDQYREVSNQELDSGRNDFELWITEVDKSSKVTIVRLIMDMMGLGIGDAKKLVDNLPSFVMNSDNQETLRSSSERLNFAGAKCEIRNNGVGIEGKSQPISMDKFGKIVCDEKIARKRIQIFENGYVSVNGGLPERLISVKGDAEVTKKTGPGRFVTGSVAFMATGGLIAAEANSMRGNVYLYINTEFQSHAIELDLKNTTKYVNPVAVMNKVVASAERVIQLNSAKQVHVVTSTALSELDVSAQLEKLASLHQMGALTDEEFSAAKMKLLS